MYIKGPYGNNFLICLSVYLSIITVGTPMHNVHISNNSVVGWLVGWLWPNC